MHWPGRLRRELGILPRVVPGRALSRQEPIPMSFGHSSTVHKSQAEAIPSRSYHPKQKSKSPEQKLSSTQVHNHTVDDRNPEGPQIPRRPKNLHGSRVYTWGNAGFLASTVCPSCNLFGSFGALLPWTSMQEAG